jgi:dihydroxy-acid dehydratase
MNINVKQLLIQLNVDAAEIVKRRAAWKAPAPRYTRGVLRKYFKLVGTASKGAVTD